MLNEIKVGQGINHTLPTIEIALVVAIFKESYVENIRSLSMSDSKKTTRVQMELAERSMQRLASLKEKTESSSYAEVIKNSLRVYEDIIEKHDEGFEFFLKNKDGKEIFYKIF